MHELGKAVQGLQAESRALNIQVLDLHQRHTGSTDSGRRVMQWRSFSSELKTSMRTTFTTRNFAVETTLEAILLERAVILQMSASASTEITCWRKLKRFCSTSWPLHTCKDEAFAIVRNVSRGGVGSEAWRRVFQRHGTKTRGNQIVRNVSVPSQGSKSSQKGPGQTWASDKTTDQAQNQ